MKTPTIQKWHNAETAEVLNLLDSQLSGLTQTEVTKRLTEYGQNELREAKKISPWLILLEQFKNFLIIILLIAVVLSAILGEVADAIVIFVIVLFAAILGFIQEYRAERAMEALKRMAAPTASVIRDGHEQEVPSRELVPGDIVLLRTGDKIPADARIIEAVNLKTEEAPLTGESVPIEKTSSVVTDGASVGDRKNMIFAGTSVVYGRSMAIVTNTGMTTEFGKIATMLQEVETEETPLQVNLDKMGKWIGIGALALCFVLGAMGVMRGHEILEMFIWAISLAIAAVPEALPAVVTISLSLGVQKMVKRHALIRKLPAVETLGSTDYICSDKTGTLTQDQMTVRRVYTGGMIIDVTGSGYEPKGQFISKTSDFSTQNPSFRSLLMAGLQCNDSTLEHSDNTWKIKGDPTEGALVVLAEKAGINQQEVNIRNPRIHEIPFTSETKRMTTLHRTETGRVSYSKGALEVILDSCGNISIGGREAELTEKIKHDILETANKMAADALRVLGLAYKSFPDKDIDDTSMEKSMIFLGMVGMVDPPREEVKPAIALCDQAGIKTVMITGDHKLTAVSIATELGILKNGLALSGEELDNLSDDEFEKIVEKIEVYARVSPAHKLRVIEALSKKGHVVAMTGDGVNDAPALKRADIGIAMGISGTDVTKEAADMVLTDDNFASIVAAVEEGRGIFNNIKKYLIFLLSCNLGEIILMAAVILFGPLMGLPPGTIPLIAIQLLYVNLATDGLPAIALSVEPPDKDIMQLKPRPKKQTIFSREVMGYLVAAGIWTAVITLLVFLWAVNSGKSFSEAQSLCFITLILVEFFNAFNCRNLNLSVFKIGVFSNKWLIYAILATLAITLSIFYVPFLQGVFNSFSLGAEDWIISILAASTIFIAAEIYKFGRNKVISNQNHN